MKRLSRVFGQPQTVAVSVFFETAATAALFSKAVALVIDHIFNDSKATDVHNYLHPKDEKGDGEVISLIREALRELKFHSLGFVSEARVYRPPGPWPLLGRAGAGCKINRVSVGELWVRFCF
jgi:hypothetical protein